MTANQSVTHDNFKNLPSSSFTDLKNYPPSHPGEVCQVLNKTLKTIYTDLNRNPHRLPPKIIIPGSRKLLFLNVYYWLEQKLAVQQATPKRRGRPTKKSQKGGL